MSEPTRLRVQEVGTRLGYTPHGAAQSLITRRTQTIGVLLPDLYGEFFSEVIRGIDQAARAKGYHVLVSSAHRETPAMHAALRAMRGRVDGLIVMAPDIEARSHLAGHPTRVPMVLLNSGEDAAGAGCITVANYAGAYAMVRHLIRLGHRRIAILKGSDGNLDAAERLRGYRAALADAGIDAAPGWEVAGDFDEHSGFAAAEQVLRLRPVPTALFAANDTMAIGALSALRRAGLRVPADIALTGFDDIPLARYLDPPLTSVHVDISALGELAATRLLQAMTAPSTHRATADVLPTTLVVRASCGAEIAAAGTTSYPTPVERSSSADRESSSVYQLNGEGAT